MARLAKGRSTYLTRDEIVEAALALFDAGADKMSVRNLATNLGVTTTAIYHHFPSRYDIVLAVVNRVWDDALEELQHVLGDAVDYEGDPTELFVAGAVATRRAFGRHWRVARYVVARADPTRRLAGGLAIMAVALEQLGFTGERAAAALYAITNYTLGAVVVTACRREADEELLRSKHADGDGAFSSVELRPEDAPVPADDTSRAIDDVFAAVLDSDRTEVHEDLFVAGLRSLISGLRQA